MSSILLKWVLMCIFCIQVPSAEKWLFSIYTGTIKNANTDGNVLIQLKGEIQSSSVFDLDNPGNDFERGAINDFYKTTPPLGHLQTVIIYMKVFDGWFLQKAIIKNLITNGTCELDYKDWVTKVISWNVSNQECAKVPSASKSSDIASETRKLTNFSGSAIVQTSTRFSNQKSMFSSLIESPTRISQTVQMSLKLYPSQTYTHLFSRNEYQTVTASAEMKKSFTNDYVISSATSLGINIISELDMYQTSTPLLFTTKSSSRTLESFPVKQTAMMVNSTSVLSTINIPASYSSYTAPSSIQEVVSSSKLCVPLMQVIERENPSMGNSSCVCHLMNFSLLSKEAKIKQLIKELTIDPKSLSKYKRKKISAPDHRVSAQAIGYVGVVTLIFPFALIIILDLITLAKYYFKI